VTTPWYQRSYRRMLVDMHIPDWNEAFLAKYDPVKMAEWYELAGLTSVMCYCQSHVGLCYWPTKTGKMHAGLRGRDIVAELLAQLTARKMAACAYYSVIYNNWAFLEHPEWRIVAAKGPAEGSTTTSRYGYCCPNNPGYRAFALAQTEEIVGGYSFDGIFFDMTFWPAICVCPHCRALFRQETGKEIPLTVDWLSLDWCEFQAARERWISQFAADLTARAKGLNPRISVYHQFACAMLDWRWGTPFTFAAHHDFLGADFYGDPLEQLVVTKLMCNLTTHRPPEFMTSRCVSLQDHVRMKRYEAMEMQAFAATLFSSAFLFIDAINVEGTVNPAVYEWIGRIFGETAKYEPYLGGGAVEDIAVYYSSESKMDFAENGTPLSQVERSGNAYPHARAVRGACRVLQQAHLPFGVITRKQLPVLDRYRVVVLPNVLRMDEEEVEAFRSYVNRGGRLYASLYTSLTETRGCRHRDFMLAEVFGCHLEDDDLGKVAYIKPVVQELAKVVAPQDYVSHAPLADNAGGVLRLAKKSAGRILATLTLPYAAPAAGTVFDQQWASIHSSPPWEDTDHPMIVSHQYGKGQVIYAAADIESVNSEVNDRLFLALLHSLCDEMPSYTAEAHPAVWMNVSHQPEKKALVIGFLNCQAQLPAVPVGRISFALRPLPGTRFTKLLLLPEEAPAVFTVDADGTLHAETGDLRVCRMLKAEYERG